MLFAAWCGPDPGSSILNSRSSRTASYFCGNIYELCNIFENRVLWLVLIYIQIDWLWKLHASVFIIKCWEDSLRQDLQVNPRISGLCNFVPEKIYCILWNTHLWITLIKVSLFHLLVKTFFTIVDFIFIINKTNAVWSMVEKCLLRQCNRVLILVQSFQLFYAKA